MNRHHIDPDTWRIYHDYKIYGLRRPLWVDVIDPQVRTQGDDILIDFTLPSSAYASVLVEKVLQQVGIRNQR